MCLKYSLKEEYVLSRYSLGTLLRKYDNYLVSLGYVGEQEQKEKNQRNFEDLNKELNELYQMQKAK